MIGYLTETTTCVVAMPLVWQKELIFGVFILVVSSIKNCNGLKSLSHSLLSVHFKKIAKISKKYLHGDIYSEQLDRLGILLA